VSVSADLFTGRIYFFNCLNAEVQICKPEDIDKSKCLPPTKTVKCTSGSCLTGESFFLFIRLFATPGAICVNVLVCETKIMSLLVSKSAFYSLVKITHCATTLQKSTVDTLANSTMDGWRASKVAPC
jgi:hypothetical protein